MAEEIDRYYYERTAAEHGFECVCGIDEADLLRVPSLPPL